MIRVFGATSTTLLGEQFTKVLQTVNSCNRGHELFIVVSCPNVNVKINDYYEAFYAKGYVHNNLKMAIHDERKLRVVDVR